MAKLNVVNTKLQLPVYNKFIASQPVITSCYFQDNTNSTVYNRAYYYNGSNEPKVGDTIFLDINGLEKYAYSLSYIQFKEDVNNFYYLYIVNSKVVTIEICPKVEFIEFDMLDQTSATICQDNSFYPTDLTSVADVFYHGGEGQFPAIGDVIYNSTVPNDTLNNFVGLFNILNEIYYYLYTNADGIVYDIRTCNKPEIYPTRNISLIPITNYIDGDYTKFNCDIPLNTKEILYYKSELQRNPVTGTKVYSDYNLTTLITNKSYLIGGSDKTLKFILVNNEGIVSYTSCEIFVDEPIKDPNPDVTENYYFYGGSVTSFCDKTRNLVKYYYDKNTTGGGYGVIPPLLTVVYSDNNLTNIQSSKIIFLSSRNNIATYLMTNALGQYYSNRTCDLQTTDDTGDSVFITPIP